MNAFSADYCEGTDDWGTDDEFYANVEDCMDVAPCSKRLTLKLSGDNTQTCTDYCELETHSDLTCVASWTTDGAGCSAVEQSTCGQEYDTDTAVVCVCARVAKCTLFAKCDKHSKVSNKIAMFDEEEFAKNRVRGFSIDPRM